MYIAHRANTMHGPLKLIKEKEKKKKRKDKSKKITMR